MTVALVEPALYVFSGRTVDPAGEAFEVFWALFDKLRSLIRANNARLHCTDILHEAINGLFPWDHSPAAGIEFYHSAAVQVARFLDAHLIRPIWEYGGSEEAVEFYPPLDRHGLYGDDDVSLAWGDQLARHAMDPDLCPPTPGGELLATREGWSCLTQAIRCGADLEVRGQGGFAVRIRPVRMDQGALPAGWVDPEVLEELRALRAASRAEVEPDIDFEKTGHGPNIRIKRAIELLGSDVRDLVVRIASDRHVPGATDLCKLEADPEVDTLRYRIGSGKEVLKGVIQTRARDEREQAVALAFIMPRFLARCRTAGFRVLDN